MTKRPEKQPAKGYRHPENEMLGQDFDISDVNIGEADESLSDEQQYPIIDEGSGGWVKIWETVQIHLNRRARSPRE